MPLFDFLELLNLNTTLKITSYDNKHHKKNISPRMYIYIYIFFFAYFYSQHKVVPLLQVIPLEKRPYPYKGPYKRSGIS